MKESLRGVDARVEQEEVALAMRRGIPAFRSVILAASADMLAPALRKASGWSGSVSEPKDSEDARDDREPRPLPCASPSKSLRPSRMNTTSSSFSSMSIRSSSCAAGRSKSSNAEGGRSNSGTKSSMAGGEAGRSLGARGGAAGVSCSRRKRGGSWNCVHVVGGPLRGVEDGLCVEQAECAQVFTLKISLRILDTHLRSSRMPRAAPPRIVMPTTNAA
mmetsp:Transcript_35417/g.97988  ORF Transcript_35417/g.97988 Transcript_35417/m.97988 type:complete len:218 (+) Transcript_35417:356-1009(+)